MFSFTLMHVMRVNNPTHRVCVCVCLCVCVRAFVGVCSLRCFRLLLRVNKQSLLRQSVRTVNGEYFLFLFFSGFPGDGFWEKVQGLEDDKLHSDLQVEVLLTIFFYLENYMFTHYLLYCLTCFNMMTYTDVYWVKGQRVHSVVQVLIHRQ
jgi:hypothetical protein